jgi:hypothetical protein
MTAHLTNNDARRVLVSISAKSGHWPRAWDHSEEVINTAVACIERNGTAVFSADRPPQPSVIVKEKWTTRLWIVFDIFNNSYDADKAHLPETNDLPVIMVSLSEKDVVTTSKLIEGKVNEGVREAYDAHGVGSRPPFIIDHTNDQIPTYPNPRTQCV